MVFNIRIIVSLLFFVFFAVSCDEDNAKNDEYSPLEGNVLFTLAPDSADGIGTTGNIALYLKTDSIYNCINYELVHEADIQSDRIDITIEGIVLPEGICATAIGPARAKISLGIGSGEFDLRFTYDSQTDRYDISLSDSSIVVVPFDTSFTR